MQRHPSAALRPDPPTPQPPTRLEADVIDPEFVTLLAIGAFLVVGGLFDIGWRRRTGVEQDL